MSPLLTAVPRRGRWAEVFEGGGCYSGVGAEGRSFAAFHPPILTKEAGIGRQYQVARINNRHSPGIERERERER